MNRFQKLDAKRLSGVALTIPEMLEWEEGTAKELALIAGQKLVELLNKLEPVKQLYFLSKSEPDALGTFQVALRNLFDDLEALEDFGTENKLFGKHSEMNRFTAFPGWSHCGVGN
jgi:hypothetical protein